MNNSITFDLEEYFQVEALRPFVEFENWGRHEPRMEHTIHKVLSLLDAQRMKGTFFVLGWNAERSPHIIREIHGLGHEIASHGYSHRMIREQTPDEFREDIRKAKNILEDSIGEEVIGYRAPTFSITEQTLWALDILAEEGFKYDSSIFPVRHDRYGIPAWSRYMETVRLDNGHSIIEIPPLTARVFGFNLPLGGGGYFRLTPLWASTWAIRRMNAEGHPAVLYLHPWELDPAQPRFPMPTLQRFRQYVNLASTQDKLKALLSSGSFTRLKDILPL